MGADPFETLRPIRQVLETLMAQLRHQIPRFQTRNTKQEVIGQVHALITVIQQHAAMIDGYMGAMIAAMGDAGLAAPGETGESAAPKPPLVSPVPEPAAKTVANSAMPSPDEVAEASLARVKLAHLEKRLSDLDQRLAMFQECRDFLLLQMEEVDRERSDLEKKLEVSRSAAKKQMLQIVQLERALAQKAGPVPGAGSATTGPAKPSPGV